MTCDCNFVFPVKYESIFVFFMICDHTPPWGPSWQCDTLLPSNDYSVIQCIQGCGIKMATTT